MAQHDTADKIAAEVRDDLGPVSAQLVHDVLRACSRAGLPREVESAGRLVCRSCGRTEDVACAAGPAPSSSAGYAVDGAEVVFRGLCPDCRSRDIDI